MCEDLSLPCEDLCSVRTSRLALGLEPRSLHALALVYPRRTHGSLAIFYLRAFAALSLPLPLRKNGVDSTLFLLE